MRGRMSKKALIWQVCNLSVQELVLEDGTAMCQSLPAISYSQKRKQGGVCCRLRFKAESSLKSTGIHFEREREPLTRQRNQSHLANTRLVLMLSWEF